MPCGRPDPGWPMVGPPRRAYRYDPILTITDLLSTIHLVPPWSWNQIGLSLTLGKISRCSRWGVSAAVEARGLLGEGFDSQCVRRLNIIQNLTLSTFAKAERYTLDWFGQFFIFENSYITFKHISPTCPGGAEVESHDCDLKVMSSTPDLGLISKKFLMEKHCNVIKSSNK
jgi:hypothetical protein